MYKWSIVYAESAPSCPGRRVWSWMSIFKTLRAALALIRPVTPTVWMVEYRVSTLMVEYTLW